MARSSAAHSAADRHGLGRGGTMILVAAMVVIVMGTGGLFLQLTAQHKGGAAPVHVQQELLGMQNSTAQLNKLTTVIEQLQQQFAKLESQGLDGVHTAVSSTKQAVAEVPGAVKRASAHASSTGTKLGTLVSKAGAAAHTFTVVPCPSPSPAPRLKRLVVSMSSFPGRAELAIPTVYSIMYGKRVPDAFYFWVAVNVSRLGPDHDAANEIPGPAKSVGDQFKGVLKVQVPSKDYGPATKLLPTLQVETDPETVIVTIDDDTYYHQDTVYDLEQEMIRRRGHAVVRSCEDTFRDTSVSPQKTWRSWNLNEGLCKGFMTAYASAAYRRSFFDDEVFKQELGPVGCKHHDDIWFSGHLWVRQVPIWILRPHVHAWPPMYHRPTTKLSISAHPDAERHALQCLDYFGWMSRNSSDIRAKLLGGRQTIKQH